MNLRNKTKQFRTVVSKVSFFMGNPGDKLQ